MELDLLSTVHRNKLNILEYLQLLTHIYANRSKNSVITQWAID